MINELAAFLLINFVIFCMEAFRQMYYLGKLDQSEEEIYYTTFKRRDLIGNIIIFIVLAVWVTRLMRGQF